VRKAISALAVASLLSGCALVPGAVVGAALSPVVTPIVDRALIGLGLTWIDPSNTTAIRDYDKGKAP